MKLIAFPQYGARDAAQRYFFQSLGKFLDYKSPDRNHYVWETTVGAQKAHNIHVHDGVAEDDFVAMRTRRDATLDLPNLILPSVQVNVRGGKLPPPESNGKRYLKIPLDAL